jgi:stage V sporulation protein AE
MIYLNAFLFVGTACLIGQLILDNSKLTPGHVTSIFVSIGAILSFLGIYKYFIEWAKIGASVPILSFGNLLYQAALEGFYANGFLGIFTNMFKTTSGGISEAIIFAFIMTIIFKPKD